MGCFRIMQRAVPVGVGGAGRYGSGLTRQPPSSPGQSAHVSGLDLPAGCCLCGRVTADQECALHRRSGSMAPHMIIRRAVDDPRSGCDGCMVGG